MSHGGTSSIGIIMKIWLIVLLALTVSALAVKAKRYEPNWTSLDSRPLPQWYDEAKFGIFLHWGVFSVPSFTSAWFWYFWETKQKAYVEFMKKNYPPNFTYADFAPMFRAEFYDPNEWAEIFEAAGARYVVLVTKHHEGFCNWPSKVSWNWNSMDVGPKRDLTGELATAIRNKTSIRFGIYHSLFEFFNPLYLQDKANNYKTQNFVRDKAMPELYELITTYKPDILWSDGSWQAPDTYWNSTHFLAWLYNDSPVKDHIVTNDRWGKGLACQHGDFYNCHDKYNPGHLLKHKWENALSIDKTRWTYRRNVQLSDLMDTGDVIKMLAETVSCGGNMLLNVGPTSDGQIVPIFEEKLRQIGSWLKVNGESIYSTKPWTNQNDTITPGVWYTSKNNSGSLDVYAIVLNWPIGSLVLGAPLTTAKTAVTLLGYEGHITWTPIFFRGMVIQIPTLPVGKMPCKWAWVFKLENLT